MLYLRPEYIVVMKKILKIYLFTTVLLSDFILFAQPGDDDGGGGLEGDDPQPAPINGKLLFLAAIGILFVVYTFRKNKRTV